MRLNNAVPKTAIRLDTYAQLREFAAAFAAGRQNLLIILGNGGIGKSRVVERAMLDAHGNDGWALIKGKHTPLNLYETLYGHRDQPILLDDLDGLLDNRDNVAMLKCVCETADLKTVQWGSSHTFFTGPEARLPKQFITASKTCIIANDWRKPDRNLAALLDRGVVVVFEPSPIEVHKEIARGGWFADAEVFEFIGRHLFLISEPSFRLYLKAQDFRGAEMDWRKLTLESMGSDLGEKTLLVARLLADPQYDSEAKPGRAREVAFAQLGGGSRKTYYRHKRVLKRRQGKFNENEVATIVLQPCSADGYNATILARFGSVICVDSVSSLVPDGLTTLPRDRVLTSCRDESGTALSGGVPVVLEGGSGSAPPFSAN